MQGPAPLKSPSPTDRRPSGSFPIDDAELATIPANGLSDRYDQLGLDVVPDAELVAAASRIVATPRQGPGDSFVLHAPLELAARSALLPLVAPAERRLARLRVLAVAAQYNDYQPMPVIEAGHTTPQNDRSALRSNFTTMLADGDGDAAERAAIALAESLDGRELAALLAESVIPMTAAAGHGSIFLYHIARRDPTAGLDTRLLRPLARALAGNPDWRIGWTDSWQPGPPSSPETMRKIMAEIPLLGRPGSSFIHPLVMQVDEGGVADERLSPVLGARSRAAENELLRIAARMMLTDTPDEAPYGWSHTLTIPQAILGITRGSRFADLGLAIAATHVAAFRAGLGAAPLSQPDVPDAAAGDITRLATRAAASHDAHVVKYVLACIDAAGDDPAAKSLFLASAQRLLDLWVDRGGDPTDPLA